MYYLNLLYLNNSDTSLQHVLELNRTMAHTQTKIKNYDSVVSVYFFATLKSEISYYDIRESNVFKILMFSLQYCRVKCRKGPRILPCGTPDFLLGNCWTQIH